MENVKEFYKNNYKTIKDLSVRHIELVDHAAQQGIGLDVVDAMVKITSGVHENEYDELVTKDVEGARKLFGDVRVVTAGISETEYAVINKSQPKHTKYLTSDGRVYLISRDVADVGDRVIIRPSQVVRTVTQRDSAHDVWVDRPVELHDQNYDAYEEEYFTTDEYLKVIDELDHMVIRESDNGAVVDSATDDNSFGKALTKSYDFVMNSSRVYPNPEFYRERYRGWLFTKPYDTTRTSGHGEVVGITYPNVKNVFEIGTLHQTGDDKYLFIRHSNGQVTKLDKNKVKNEVVEILFVTRNENIPRMAIFGGGW